MIMEIKKKYISISMKWAVTMLSIIYISGIFTLAEAQQSVFDCGTELTGEPSALDKNDGKHVTAHGTLRILVVFAKFPDGSTNNIPSYWDDGYPSFATNSGENAFIDGTADQQSDHFMNLTNYFRQMSMGKLTVLGDVVKVEAPKASTEYDSRHDANRDILKKIDVDMGVDFSPYDNWENTGDYMNKNDPDGKVDMIAMIWRGDPISSNGDQLFSHEGEASLDSGHNLDVDNNQRVINFSFRSGSGFTVKALSSARSLFQDTIHEFAHWLLGGVHPYSDNDLTKPDSYDGPIHRVWSMLQNSFIRANSANTFERDRLGWINAVEITQNTTGQLGDFYDTGEAYVYHPDNGETNEFFYIENHQDISIYDDATKNSGDKGMFVIHQKGLYGDDDNNRNLSSDGDYQWKQNKEIQWT